MSSRFADALDAEDLECIPGVWHHERHEDGRGRNKKPRLRLSKSGVKISGVGLAPGARSQARERPTSCSGDGVVRPNPTNRR